MFSVFKKLSQTLECGFISNYIWNYYLENWKNKMILSHSHSRFLCRYDIQFRIFEKNKGKLNFVIIDVTFSLKRNRLWSWYYPTHSLRHSVTFFVVSWLCFKYIRDFIWVCWILMPYAIQQHIYLKDYRRHSLHSFLCKNQ